MIAAIRGITLLLIATMLSSCTILQPRKWPAGSGKIVLTFDDGPVPGISGELLDVLKKHNVHATFFVIGENAKRHPEFIRRAVAEGHIVGNHTYTHSPMTLLSSRRLDREILESDTVINQAAGTSGPTRYFRSPFGVVTPWVRFSREANSRSEGYLTFFVYDPDADESTSPGVLKKIKAEFLKRRGGAIVLHEMRYFSAKSPNSGPSKKWLPAAVDDLILWARANGFSFATFDGIHEQEK